MSERVGTVTWINGPVIRAKGSRQVQMMELVEVGDEHLVGEVIGLDGDTITIQVYEETSGMEKAQLKMGRERVEWAALAANKTVDVTLKYRGVMGVSVPVIESQGTPSEMPYSLGDTTAALDQASAAFAKVLTLIPELSMVTTTVWRLAGEMRKTQRRVNALQYIFIPEYEDTVSFIVSSLEERDREETFRLKLLKRNMEKSEEERRLEKSQEISA